MATKISTNRSNNPVSWASWVNVAVGVWLIVAPFLLGYVILTQALWNDIILGVLIAGLGFNAATTKRSTPSWWNAASGIWLIIAPFLLQYDLTIASTNDIVSGIVVTTLALGAGISKRTHAPA